MAKKRKKSAASRNKSLKISAKSRYALRILHDLAEHSNDENSTTEAAIAERQGISEKFLSRIVLPLRDAGFISAQQGSHKGLRLLKPTAEISLLDILEIVQGKVELLDCLNDKIDCGRKSGCFAHQKWQIANEAVRTALSMITLR